MPILLDSNAIAICSRMDGDCGRICSSSKSPPQPLCPPQFPSQLEFVSPRVTLPDTPPQPPGVQLWEIPQPLSTVAPTSTYQSDGYSTLKTSPASTEGDDSGSVTHQTPSATLPPSASPLSPARDDIQTANHARPSKVSSTASPPVPLESDPTQYFKNVVEPGPKSSKRIDYLAQAAASFIPLEDINRKALLGALAIWKASFDGSGSGPIKRLEQLVRGYAMNQHHFADLLYIIYFTHEVEIVAQSEHPKVGKGKGRRRQGEAVLKIAISLGIDVNAVKATTRKFRNYRILLQQGTPGSLLQLGRGVDSLWQSRLQQDDIPILLQYRKKHLPNLEKQANALDEYASEILIACMLPFGWSYGELAATQSELTKSIQPHKDLQGLAQGRIRLEIKIPSLEEKGRDAGASENEIRGKRRCSDSDNAGHQVKQVRLSQSSAEPDMSMMTELTPNPGEQDMSSLTTLWPMPQQPDVSMLTGLWLMPGELDMSTLVEQTAGAEMYGDWQAEAHGWR